MSCLDNAAYTIKVVVKTGSIFTATPVTEIEWNEYHANPQIETFTGRFSMELRVYELRERLRKGGFIPSEKNKTTLYIASGFGEPFKEIPEGGGKSKFNNSNCELWEVIHSACNPILLALVNDYERKWDDDDCDEPYPGWQSFLK